MIRMRFLMACALTLVGFSASAAPFDCVHANCGIGIDGEYPNLVVGKVDGVMTPSQAAGLFLDARKLGLWHFMPGNAPEFAKNIQPISIEILSGHSVTVLESKEEMDTTPIKVGDFARFSPHRGVYDKPHPNDPYWFTFGCVAVLCQPGDTACIKQFRPGIYRASDGAEMSPDGRLVMLHGIKIDPMSMMLKSGN